MIILSNENLDQSKIKKKIKKKQKLLSILLILYILSEINGKFKFDTNNYNKKITRKLTITTIIKIISFIVISIGTAIALFGWIFGYLEVTSIIHEGGTMKFVTAIFFILSGFTLYSLCKFIVRKSSIFMLLYLHHLLSNLFF